MLHRKEVGPSATPRSTLFDTAIVSMSGGEKPPHPLRESLKTGIMEIQASQTQVQACLSALAQISTDYVQGRDSMSHTDLKQTLLNCLQTCRQFFEQHCAKWLDLMQTLESRPFETTHGVNTEQEAAFGTDQTGDMADSKALAYMQDDLHEAMRYAWRVKTILLQCLAQETTIQDNILYLSCKRLKSAVDEINSAEIQPNPVCQRTGSARLAYMQICVDAFDVAHTKHVMINNEYQPHAHSPCSLPRVQAALFAKECLDVQMVHQFCGQLVVFKHVQRLLFGCFVQFVLQQINIFQIAVLVHLNMHIQEYESNVLALDTATRGDVSGPLHMIMQAAHCVCRARFEHVRTDSVRLMHGIAIIDDQTVALTTFDAALEVLTRCQALRNELGNITRWWDDMMQKHCCTPV